jgi:sialic acid synthase SpsE
LGKPILLSTGASYMEEVQRAVQTIRDAGNQDVVLLHCVSTYPARPEHANLRAMQALHDALGLPVGFSDHTLCFAPTLAAVALGASVIEKHVTLDRSRPGADHGHSLEVPEFAAMVREIRLVEAALGDGEKAPGEQEVPERTGARRSLYATADIPSGTIIAPDVLRVVRHRHGVGAEEIDAVVGRVTKVNIRRNEALQWEHIEAAP